VTSSYAIAKPLLVKSSRLQYYHDKANIDKASQVLAQGVPLSVPRLYYALANYSNVPRFILYYRARGRRLMEEKA
jgi:hypothetical protein